MLAVQGAAPIPETYPQRGYRYFDSVCTTFFAVGNISPGCVNNGKQPDAALMRFFGKLPQTAEVFQEYFRLRGNTPTGSQSVFTQSETVVGSQVVKAPALALTSMPSEILT